MTREEAEADPNVISGDLLISGFVALVLFDSGATHSFISENFMRKLGREPEKAEMGYSVILPSGENI